MRKRRVLGPWNTHATIHWSLKHLVDVSPVLDDDLKDSSELYARHFKNYDAYHAFEPLLGGAVD
ncbi:hypothetical protein [Archangium sp.]|uniref:hypothetical protein n=1 Tax=Archangium sp. TaxID=1872627 RepID=UPI002D33BB9F|nr:hypothetical protein [Archangium sp.]HYO58229.1 hypothetical protein [Archangium sp.]